MQENKRQPHFFTAAAVLSIVFVVVIAAQQAFFTVRHKLVLFVVLPAAAVICALLSLHQRRQKADLIKENRILCIKNASSVLEETRTSWRGHYADIIISCFGILADNRVIKYNQDGIALKAVEIGAEYITLTYGTDSVLKKTHITYERPEGWDMAAIAERFHYETGVLPEIKERR